MKKLLVIISAVVMFGASSAFAGEMKAKPAEKAEAKVEAAQAKKEEKKEAIEAKKEEKKEAVEAKKEAK